MDPNRTYEGMFLLNASVSDFQTASEPIRDILNRADAEVLAMNPWEERRLAYEMKGCKQGLYVLAYFKADPERIGELEHDCQLNENILRVLVTRHDRISDEQVSADTPAMAAAAAAALRAQREAERLAAKEPAKADSLYAEPDEPQQETGGAPESQFATTESTEESDDKQQEPDPP